MFAERLLGSPRLYDRVQRIFGLEELREQVASALAQLEPGTLLDVGAGTANFYPVVPAGFEYTALDVDERKLSRLRQKFPEVRTVHASGTELPFGDAEFDYALCVDVSHHLLDDELDRLIAELARVSRRKLVFVDALNVPRRTSKLIWAIDRGSHPRPLDALRRALDSSFTLERFDTFTIRHVYVLAVGVPRRRG